MSDEELKKEEEKAKKEYYSSCFNSMFDNPIEKTDNFYSRSNDETPEYKRGE